MDVLMEVLLLFAYLYGIEIIGNAVDLFVHSGRK